MKNSRIYIVGLLVFLVPSIALADYQIVTTSSVGGQWSIGSGEHTNFAQIFTSSDAGDATSTAVCLYSTGTPSGTVTIELRNNNAGSPGNVSYGTSTINASSVPAGSGNAARVYFTYLTQVHVSTTTTYWVDVYRSTTDGLIVGCGGAGSTGKTSDNNGGSWSGTSSDLNILLNIATSTATSSSNNSSASSSATTTPEQLSAVGQVGFYAITLFFIALGFSIWMWTALVRL